MSQANNVQVGGTHYRSGFQHWDLVTFLQMGYFTAQITRYVARWKKKNGLQDLEKAQHYILKMAEAEGVRCRDAMTLLENFARENELGIDEQAVFENLIQYELGDGECLARARDAISDLISRARVAQPPSEDPEFLSNSDEWNTKE